MIVAPPGKVLLMCDLSQAESWVVAYLANEPRMKHALQYGDIHTETAGSAIFFPYGCSHNCDKDLRTCSVCGNVVTTEMRYIGKRWNHASAYRMKPARAAQVVNKDSDQPPYVTITVAQSTEYSKAWHSYYNLKPWWGEIEYQLGVNRTMVTPYGRKRTFFGGWGDELFKEATAFVPQSTVADHFNGAVQPELGISGGLLSIYTNIVLPNPEIKLINQSHDSCMLEVPQSSYVEVAQQMKSYLFRPIIINGETCSIPVDCEVGERWGELEKLKVA